MNPKTVTLAEIVAQRPDAARILARYRLDFCCHGQRLLSDACAEKSLDPARILSEVEAARSGAAPEERWTDRPLYEIIDHILARFHEPLRRDLPVLIEQARAVESVHADKAGCPRGLADHLSRILGDLQDHMQKEEQVLFPMIREGQGPTATMPIRVMEKDHVALGADLARTRQMTDDLVVPPEGCATWRALYEGLAALEQDLFEHIHMENNVLFPRAQAGE